MEDSNKKLPHLDNLLAKNQYVTGSLSYADIVLYDFSLLISVVEPKLLEKHSNIGRHFKTIDNLPQIKNYRAGKGRGGSLLSKKFWVKSLTV